MLGCLSGMAGTSHVCDGSSGCVVNGSMLRMYARLLTIVGATIGLVLSEAYIVV